MKNYVNLLGYLGNDATLLLTKKDKFMLAFSVATSGIGDKSLWHQVVFFNEKGVENLEKKLKKGVLVDIQGYLNPREYVKDGVPHKTTTIVANKILVIPQGKNNSNSNNDNLNEEPKSTNVASVASFTSTEPPIDFDDDIPF